MALLDDLKRSKKFHFLGDDAISKVTEWVSTQCGPLDWVMGGGVPVGRIVEIYGDTSTGKSLVAEHILAETQERGGVAVLYDSESAASESMLANIGIDVPNLVYSTPETVEEIYESFEELIDRKERAERDLEPGEPGELLTVVWDSVAATSTDKEIEDIRKKGMGAATMGIHARLISQMCRVFIRTVAKHRLCLVFINQTRSNIGVMYGPNETTFGGRAIGYYSSVRVRLDHRRRIKDRATGDALGIQVKAFNTKNKVSVPFRSCEFPVIFDYGIDEPEAFLDWLKKRKIVTGSSWKVIEINGEEVKFQDSRWDDVFYEYEDAIRDLLWT